MTIGVFRDWFDGVEDNIETFEAILEDNNIDKKEILEELDLFGNNILNILTEKGYINIIKYLYNDTILNYDDVHINVLISAEFNHLHLIKYYITNCNFPEYNFIFIIEKAAKHNSLNVIDYLMSKKNQTPISNNKFNIVMVTAVKAGNIEVIQYFIEKGFNLNNVKRSFLLTVIEESYSKRKIETIKFLLDAGIDRIEIKNHFSPEIKEILLTY